MKVYQVVVQCDYLKTYDLIRIFLFTVFLLLYYQWIESAA